MIHPTAIIEPGARLAAGVSVGAYSLIGAQVELGEGSAIGPHVVIEGKVRLGRGNRVSQFASIGGPPQDKKYAGEDTAVEIGDGNTIREYVTINRGTTGDARVTRVGDDNWIMAYVHFAHDCQIGSHTIFANACELAGHVHVGDWRSSVPPRWCTSSCRSVPTVSLAWEPTWIATCRLMSGPRAIWRSPTASTASACGAAACSPRPSTH